MPHLDFLRPNGVVRQRCVSRASFDDAVPVGPNIWCAQTSSVRVSDDGTLTFLKGGLYNIRVQIVHKSDVEIDESRYRFEWESTNQEQSLSVTSINVCCANNTTIVRGEFDEAVEFVAGEEGKVFFSARNESGDPLGLTLLGRPCGPASAAFVTQVTVVPVSA